MQNKRPNFTSIIVFAYPFSKHANAQPSNMWCDPQSLNIISQFVWTLVQEGFSGVKFLPWKLTPNGSYEACFPCDLNSFEGEFRTLANFPSLPRSQTI